VPSTKWASRNRSRILRLSPATVRIDYALHGFDCQSDKQVRL
jgi:hypothetical protein